MINMVNFFAELPKKQNSQSESGFGKTLCQETVPRSIVNQGLYFLDLYTMVIARRFSLARKAGTKASKISRGRDYNFEESCRVDDDSIRLGRMPMDPATLPTLYGSLDDIYAAFICSGPYGHSTSPSTTRTNHYYIGKENFLRVKRFQEAKP